MWLLTTLCVAVSYSTALNMSDFVPPSGYNPDKPEIEVDYSSHLSVEEKRLIIMWHCNDDLPIWSSNPKRDTCHKRIRRVRKQTVYNVIHDWLAYGYIRQRGHNRVVNHRDGHFLDAHWSTLKNYCWHTVTLPWRITQESERNLRNPVQGWGHRASNACTWLLLEKNYENGQRTGSRWQEKVSQFNSESEAVAILFLWWEPHRRTLRTPTQVFCFAKDWVIMFIILIIDRCLVACLNRGRSLRNTRLNVASDFQGIYTSVHGHVQYGT